MGTAVESAAPEGGSFAPEALDAIEAAGVYGVSIPAAVGAWCAPDADRIARWKGYMAGTVPPDHIDPGCEQAMETIHQIVRFGEAHEIRNTPTLFLADGRRIVGAMPSLELEAAIAAAERP